MKLIEARRRMGAIDVWAQMPTPRFMQEPWLDTLLRWTGKPGDRRTVTLEHTLAAMDERQ